MLSSFCQKGSTWISNAYDPRESQKQITNSVAHAETPLSELSGSVSLFFTMIIRGIVRLEAMSACPIGIEKKVDDKAPEANSKTVARIFRFLSLGF